MFVSLEGLLKLKFMIRNIGHGEVWVFNAFNGDRMVPVPKVQFIKSKLFTHIIFYKKNNKNISQT